MNHISVGPVAEGLAISPDGRHVAVTVKRLEREHDVAVLSQQRLAARVLVNKAALSLVTEASVGHWCQGVAWSNDASTILAQCVVEPEIMTFRFDGRRLIQGPAIKVSGGPSGIAASRR